MTYNLIADDLITIATPEFERRQVSLPALLALMMDDRVDGFPFLRPHQRHAWHAFLVQLAALALHSAGEREPPNNADAWARHLRALTPDWPLDEPWSLVAAPDKPALFQAPVPGGDLSAFKPVETPDALDMLITSKNHDQKAARIRAPAAEDWLYALLTLQTMEGFLGAGNYGISRMNGGFANRPALGIVPPGGPGARLRRDLCILLEKRSDIQFEQFRERDGVALVWLLPWDGVSQLGLDELDPFYIEICRRVRLTDGGGRLQAHKASSKSARINAAEAKGNVGDPWMPIDIGDAKSFSVSADGFTYRRMADLLLGETYKPALLQAPNSRDADQGLSVLACGLARGQGKTEGYHERRVPLSKSVKRMMASGHTDEIAALAKERVDDAGKMRGKVLRPALFSLLQDGPESVDYGAKSTPKQAESWLSDFERAVDEIFFSRLWNAVDMDVEEAGRQWQSELSDIALNILRRAGGSVPLASIRRYRARTRSEDLFFALLNKTFENLRQKEKEHA